MQKNGNKTKAVEATKAAPEVKEPVKAVAEKAAEPAKKPAEKAAKKPAAKKSAKKPAAKAKEAAVSIIKVEHNGMQVDVAQVEQNIKAKFVEEGHRAGNIKKLEVYIKPQDGKAYYVINDGKFDGDINLF